MDKSQLQTNTTVENIARAVFSTEAKFILGVITFVVGVVAPYYEMRQDVALIQKDISIINSNHSQHIQDLSQNVKDLAGLLEKQQSQVTVLQTQQAIILEKLK